MDCPQQAYSDAHKSKFFLLKVNYTVSLLCVSSFSQRKYSLYLDWYYSHSKGKYNIISLMQMFIKEFFLIHPTIMGSHVHESLMMKRYKIYYINTNEIPGELLRKNMISSHMKIICYLHMWKGHPCYGYKINSPFHIKKLLKWNGLVFHLVFL